MDEFLIDAKELMIKCNYHGKLAHFKCSQELIDSCKKYKVIVRNIHPNHLNNFKESYFNYLKELALEYLRKNRNIKSWESFKAISANAKVSKIFFEYGIKAEVFDKIVSYKIRLGIIESPNKITLEELFEITTIKYNYTGSLTSFRRYIEENYGSYAEYCLDKGYDINQTKWESNEAALRCAKKIGSIDAIKIKSSSLFKYLCDNNLLDYL